MHVLIADRKRRWRRRTAAVGEVAKAVVWEMFRERGADFRLFEMVEEGLPTESVEVLRREGFTFSEVHDLVLPARTLKHRLVKHQSLSIDETDRTVRVAKVLAWETGLWKSRQSGCSHPAVAAPFSDR